MRHRVITGLWLVTDDMLKKSQVGSNRVLCDKVTTPEIPFDCIIDLKNKV